MVSKSMLNLKFTGVDWGVTVFATVATGEKFNIDFAAIFNRMNQETETEYSYHDPGQKK